jgi:hypothetical protein
MAVRAFSVASGYAIPVVRNWVFMYREGVTMDVG